MRSIIAIETTSDVCSVALISPDSAMSRQTEEKRAHARMLVPLLQELLVDSRTPPSGIAVSAGPGSYTGLRIGVSTAKGLAWAKALPLYAVSTLDSMIGHTLNERMASPGAPEPISPISKAENSSELVSVIRARGEEIFACRYVVAGDRLRRVSEAVTTTISALTLSETDTLVAHEEMLLEQILDVFPRTTTKLAPLRAENLRALLLNQKDEYRVKDLSSFEPFYMKEFMAKQSAKNVFDRLPF